MKKSFEEFLKKLREHSMEATREKSGRVPERNKKISMKETQKQSNISEKCLKESVGILEEPLNESHENPLMEQLEEL